MKTYETAREILDCLVDFHFRAARLAEAAMDIEQSERVIMVLNYLYEHHTELQETLANYEDDAEEGVLNTWVPYSLNAEEAPEEFVEALEISENMEFEEAEKLARILGDYGVSLLDNIVGEIAAPHVAEVFASLLELERNEQRKLTRALNSLRDM